MTTSICSIFLRQTPDGREQKICRNLQETLFSFCGSAASRSTNIVSQSEHLFSPGQMRSTQTGVRAHLGVLEKTAAGAGSASSLTCRRML